MLLLLFRYPSWMLFCETFKNLCVEGGGSACLRVCVLVQATHQAVLTVLPGVGVIPLRVTLTPVTLTRAVVGAHLVRPWKGTIESLINSPHTLALTLERTHSLTNPHILLSFTHALTHALTPTPTLIHSFTHALMHSHNPALPPSLTQQPVLPPPHTQLTYTINTNIPT